MEQRATARLIQSFEGGVLRLSPNENGVGFRAATRQRVLLVSVFDIRRHVFPVVDAEIEERSDLLQVWCSRLGSDFPLRPRTTVLHRPSARLK